jgi:hypothetical protein
LSRPCTDRGLKFYDRLVLPDKLNCKNLTLSSRGFQTQFLLFVTFVLFCLRFGFRWLGVVVRLNSVERTTGNEQTGFEQKQTTETKNSEGNNR